MVDGLGLAETTPGPTILVNQFVGYLAATRARDPFTPLAAGVLGPLMTIWVTFPPSFVWIFAGAPHLERIVGQPRLAGALAAITAAVVGVVASLAVTFGLQVLFGVGGDPSSRPARAALARHRRAAAFHAPFERPCGAAALSSALRRRQDRRRPRGGRSRRYADGLERARRREIVEIVAVPSSPSVSAPVTARGSWPSGAACAGACVPSRRNRRGIPPRRRPTAARSPRPCAAPPR